MKLYSKLALLFVGVMAFTACSNDDDYSVGEWDGPANASTYVYFLEDEISSNEILDPSDATTKTFSVQRKDKTGELTVKFTVVENTDSVFTISDAVFADGDSVTTFTVSFPKAEMDKTYQLALKIGSAYNSSYASESTLFNYSFLIEKWNNLGKGFYTEDLMTTFFNIENLTYEVDILEKESKPGLFRVKNPYGEAYPYNEPGDWDNSKDWYLEINATDPNAVYFDKQAVGLDWGYGMVSIWSYASAAGEDYGTLRDGIITFPEGSLLISMADYQNGGFYYGNNNGAFEVVLPSAVAGVKARKALLKNSISRNSLKTVKVPMMMK